MAAIIRRHSRAHLVPRGDAFHTLARAIVGQQISVKAAQSIWNRFSGAAVQVLPERILRLKKPRLRACGLSDRKCEYLLDLAQRFADGRVHARRWDEMGDEEVIADLVQIRGVGRWTAEMVLIFSLLRPDVLPLDDLGLQKAIRLSYFKRRPARRTMARLAEQWRPWRSAATWYLWRSLDPVPVEY